jgi:hypothetical protein
MWLAESQHFARPSFPSPTSPSPDSAPKETCNELTKVSWICGFRSSASDLGADLAVTPVSSQIENDEWFPAAVTYRVHPAGRQVIRSYDYFGSWAQPLGTIIDRHTEVHPEGSLDVESLKGFHWPGPVTRITTTFDDHDSHILTFAQLSKTMPNAAALVGRWAPCQPDIAFFVARSERRTVVIPTSEVLRVSYVLTRRVFNALIRGSLEGLFEIGYIGFTGSRFALRDRQLAPSMICEAFERGKRELQQLMPRACVYWSHHARALPILIRPPFSGRVDIVGRAISTRCSADDYILFLNVDDFIVHNRFAGGHIFQ